MNLESVRKMDELGRIVIPKEMRNVLNWSSDTKISIAIEGERVSLKTHKDSCCVCGNENGIQPVCEKFICQKCINEINA